MSWIGVSESNFSYDFRVTEVCDVTVVYDPDDKSISVSGSGVSDPVYKIDKVTPTGGGEYGFLYDISWDPDAVDNQMTEVSPGVYEIEYSNIQPYSEFQFKFAANGDWHINWGRRDETEFEFGSPMPAQFNGENIQFTPDTEAEEVSIKLCLDLSEWDPVTKEGAVSNHAVIEPKKAGALLGDVDGDNEVTIYDASAIQRFLAGMTANEKLGKLM